MCPPSDQAPSRPGTKPLRIAYMAGIDRERCQARFRQSADRALDVFAFSPERCAEALAAGEPLVILHRNARHFLQSALRDGRSASDGLAEWQEACSQILATWRQARRNVLLIEEAALLRSEARALTRLTALLGAEALTEPAEMPEAASDIFALLADQALAAAPEAAALDMDLEASSLPAPQRVPSLAEVDAAVRAWQALDETTATLQAGKADAEGRADAIAAERDLLLGHVAELHDEVLGQTGTADTLRRQLLEANGSVETWKKTLANAETRFAEALAQQERTQAQLSAERDLLLGHIAELHAEVLGQSGTADTLRRQLLEANGSVETWKKTLANAETRFAETRVQQERTQAQLSAERDLLLGHVAELHDEVLGQSGTADTLRRQLLEANGSVETWKKTLAQAETRFAEALAQQERSQAQLSAERDLLLGHIAELHAEVLGQTGTADTLRRQLLEANGSVETWKKTLAKAETRFAEALAQQERSQAQLNAERDLLLGHIAELQRETEAKEQQLRDRAEDIARLTAERAALRESGDRQRRDMADDMTRKLHAARQTVARQETELTELSAELAKLRQDGAQQRQVQSDEMVRRIQNAQSEAETARQTVAELESALASLTAQNAHHAAQAAALAKELDSARDHWDGILKQAEQRELALRQSLEDLSKEYGKLLASRSWKITEPLRAANTLLGRTKHKEH